MMLTMSDQPLYLQLAERIAVQVRGGSLRAGTRLPSVRAFATQHEVSVSTAVQAYRALEDWGLIEPRPKSGYFVLPQRARAPEPASTRPPKRVVDVAPHALVDTLMCAARDPDLVSFGAACPDGGAFSGRSSAARVRAWRATPSRHARALPDGARVRGHPPGHRPARHAFGLRARSSTHRRDGRLHRGHRLVSARRHPARRCGRDRIANLLRVFAIAAGGWACALSRCRCKPRAGLSLEALELALDTQPIKAMLAVPTLANPLGTTMPLDAKRRLAQMLARRGIPLIEDVLQNELAPSQDARRAVKSFDDTGNVMLCGSFGKTLAPGLRLGWVEAGRWAPQVARMKTVFSGGCTELLELTVAELLTQGGYEQTLRHLRAVFAQQVAHARRVVSESFPAGTRVTDPAGGFILWVELPRGLDTHRVVSALFRAGHRGGAGCLVHREFALPQLHPLGHRRALEAMHTTPPCARSGASRPSCCAKTRARRAPPRANPTPRRRPEGYFKLVRYCVTASKLSSPSMVTAAVIGGVQAFARLGQVALEVDAQIILLLAGQARKALGAARIGLMAARAVLGKQHRATLGQRPGRHRRASHWPRHKNARSPGGCVHRALSPGLA